MLKRVAALFALAVVSACASQDRQLEAVETLYADFADAGGALDTIESGFVASFADADRAAWQTRYDESLSTLNTALAPIEPHRLSPHNQRALAAMRAAIAYRSTASLAPDGDCAAAPVASGAELSAALYACFSSVGDAIAFEGAIYARTAALQSLEKVEAPEQRRALFFAMAPLWQAVNGANEPTSPYRRLIAAEQERMRANIANAEASVGLPAGEGKAWLIAALEAWRDNAGAAPAEPWDFRYNYAAGARAVASCAPLSAISGANARYFADLGADLDGLGVLQDVGARPGMAPVDYADFARVGRNVDGAWRPAIPRISVILQQGGIGSSYELAHESGHAVHYAAMRTRPSLFFPDDTILALEAFADAPAWSAYTPAWQQKYLGCAADAAAGVRTRLGAVVLDIAWGLFEIRLSENPQADPNAVWTQITHDYLGIVAHPDLSWWAVRGQLVDDPGYMIHYALGAFVTADVRARVEADIGAFDAGNARWYGYVSERLFRRGGEIPSSDLLQEFLGRAVSPNALLAELRSLRETRARR